MLPTSWLRSLRARSHSSRKTSDHRRSQTGRSSSIRNHRCDKWRHNRPFSGRVSIEPLENRLVLTTITVNTLADTVGTDPAVMSLRDAITAANLQRGDNTINFSVTGTINLTGALPDLSSNIQIEGPGADSLTVRRDTGGDYRVFTVDSGDTVGLGGLTISNGFESGGAGGGIGNEGGALTVSNSTLSGNHADYPGGGIYNHYGTLTVDNCTLSGNSAYDGGGIGNQATLTVDNSTFTGNSAALYGGGIENLYYGTLTVQNSTFSDNSAGAYGGAINNGDTATVQNCALSGNSAGSIGGGIYNQGTLTVESSTLGSNSSGGGGGIYNDGTLTVYNDTLTGNSAGPTGGGIYNHGTATVDDTTLSGNSAYGGGAGIYISSSATTTLNNTIVAANFSDSINDIYGTVDSSSSHNLISVDTNLSGISNGVNGNQVGTASAPINPMLGLLKNNGGPTETMAPLLGSPAINVGDNSVIPAGVTTDQRGVGYPRINGGTVDIGAVELVLATAPPSTFVVTNLADSGPGSLRQAILDANTHVGADIVQFASELAGTIALTSGELAITDDALDIQGPGASVITVSGNNQSRVFDVTADASFEGLTISGGNASNGGGIYNAYGTLTVTNCTVCNNSAVNGGGIYNAYGALTVNDDVLSGNVSSGTGGSGGGIWNANYGTQSIVANTALDGNSANDGGGILNSGTLSIDNSVLAGNFASSVGGGIYNWGTLTVLNSTLADNVAGGLATGRSNGAGGGIFNNGPLTVENCTLSNNSADSTAGGIENLGGTTTVENSIFSGNSCHYYGGGILNLDALVIDGSTFSGNSAAYGAGINNWPNATATVENSTVRGNSAGYEGGGIHNRGTMAVQGSTLSGNSAGSGGGIFNNGGALSVQNSTFSGNRGGSGGGGMYNTNGTLTVDDCTISGNASGYLNGGGIYISSTGTTTLNNTIVAANFADRPVDIAGALDGSSSHNFIGVDTGLSGIANGTNDNQIGTANAPINPMLGSLQDNGGPTATMALLPGSSAINAGDNRLIPAGVTTDQRGAGYPRIEGGTVDIGAFELAAVTYPASTFMVSNLDDNGTGSLRQAVLDANAHVGPDVIQFAPGLTGTITLTSGELDIADDSVDIQGPGAGIITVSGNDASRVFDVTADATIRGLTITGESADQGGGIYNAYGTLTVQNCTLTGNTAGTGSGIFNAYGGLTVDGSIFSGNSASDSGGGIYNGNYGTSTEFDNSTLSGNLANYGAGIINDGALSIDGSLFSGNSASSQGGGISNNGSVAVQNSTFSSNSAYAGGGILNRGTLTVNNSTLRGNSADQGGGIDNNGTLTVGNSTLRSNSAREYGGGIFSNSTLRVEGSTFSGNSANSYGGGILNEGNGTVVVNDSTFSGNDSFNYGGGLANGGSATVQNCTLTGNTAGTAGGIYNGGTLTVQNSALTGNYSAAYGGGIYNDNGTLTVQDSTITGNFASFGGGGIYVRGSSTLVNTIVAANSGPDDINGAVDSSSSHNLIGVDTDLSGITNGSSGNLIGTANAPINPMLGTLKHNGGPTATMALLPGSSAINAGDNSLIPAGVTTDQRGAGYPRIEGGTVDIGAFELVVVTNPPTTFVVTNLDDNGAGSLRQAIIDANAHLGPDIIQFAPGLTGTITLTSGELDIADDSVDIQGPGAGIITVSGNNASRVFDVTADATIKGLTITEGSADQGGGIYNAYGTLTVQDCTLSSNLADAGGGIFNAYGALTVDGSIFSGNSSSVGGDEVGGGIYNANYGTSTVVRNSIFSGNSANYGGGIDNNGTLVVNDSTFSGDSATNRGGGISNGGTLTVDSSTFSGNSAYSGGGIDNQATLTVGNSTLRGNSADQGGGIDNNGTLTVGNSTLRSNSAREYGGGIFSNSTLRVEGSTFNGNSANSYGGGILNEGNGTVVVNDSTFSGNDSFNYGGGLANGGWATVQNCTLTGNTAGTGGGIYNGGTLTVQNSTLTGNYSAAYGGGIFTRGTSTLVNTIVAANIRPDDINGAVDGSSSHNLIGVDTNLSGIINGSNGNQVGTADAPINPMLGSLQGNGGPTETMALLPGSPAINTGDNSLIPSGITTDQRGAGYPRILGGTVDIGAYEFGVSTMTVLTSDHPSGSTYGQTLTFTATVSATISGAGTPVGSVQFIVDGANYGAAETLVGAAATLSLSSLSAGPHTIAADYTSSSSTFFNSASDPNFTVSVAPAHLTVTADNQTMVYGGAQPALTYKIAGFVNGETLATSGVSGAPSLSTVTANSHVGTYAITVAVGTLAAANYDFPAGNLVNGSLSITPATLTVTANNASRLYLATNPTFTDKITGFVNGDTPGVVSGAASLTTTATTASPVGSYPITAAQGTLSASNYTFTFVNGTLTVAAADSVYVLNSSANGAMTIAGNASLKLGGVLQVDSHSSTAIQASGNAAVKATSIQVVGGYAASGNASLSPKPATGAASVPDPLAILPSPSTAGMTNFGALSVGGNTSKTINPGIYSQITVSGNATLTMNAGTYVIEGGGMTVSGNASVSGSGEFIFNAGSGYTYNTTTGTATDGGNFGGITFSGNGKFSLSGPTSGTYAGIVIDQARDNTRAISLGGNATSGITSTIYAANALLTVSGNAQLTGSVVVGTLNASGNVALTQMAAGSDGAGDVAGIADTLLAGNLDVYVDNSSGGFSPDALARIQNAIGVWNALLVPYSESVVQVSDRSLANIVIDSGTTSASGDAGDGVLGCFNSAANEITLLQGWNWYTGADASQIGADQYDFQTTVTHELGHALGLGGANDPNSPMYESLATGVAHRTVSIADLNIPEPPEGADPQMAAGCVDVESAPTANALTSADSQGHDAPVIVVPLNVANGTGRSSNPVAALTQGEILTGKTAIEPPLEFWLDSLAYGALSSPLEKISGASTLRLEGSQTSGPFDTSSSQQHTRAQSDDIGTGPDELFASVFGVTDDNDPGEPCAVPLTCAVDNGLLIVRSVAFLASVMHQRHEHSDAVARRTWSHRGTREASR